jgi:hypothetical protein
LGESILLQQWEESKKYAITSLRDNKWLVLRHAGEEEVSVSTSKKYPRFH